MIDGNPIGDPSSLGEVARKRPEVGHVASILGKTMHPELMMAVHAAFRGRRAIGMIAIDIEHQGLPATPGRAICI
ncbi:hypothetical protein [Bradyrhizobium sp. CCBAU 11434]|uniref:hypothetical protein n=1 Tax=Bradyrhizobium sp. CCBAU 11434 TaxID=1630885 RepID=UPI00230629BD|nr:hypothetical protein [Bradyrhizobium sp. CCBAU 11434]